MSSTPFPRSPKTLRGGLVLLDPQSGGVLRTIAFQYNPETLTRTLTPHFSDQQTSDRTNPVRFKAPAAEQIKVEAEIDGTDQLEAGDPGGLANGIHPQIAVLEGLVNPSVARLRDVHALSSQGMLEILPAEAPLVVFVWGPSRVVPVKVTDLSITEEAFDPSLNPIRARVSLGMRVLTVYDLGFSHRGGSLFLAWLESRESMAKVLPPATFAALGITGIP